MTKVGASKLAKQIERYWAKLGFNIETKVVMVGEDGDLKPIYAIRSDMVDGWPDPVENLVLKRAA